MSVDTKFKKQITVLKYENNHISRNSRKTIFDISSPIKDVKYESTNLLKQSKEIKEMNNMNNIYSFNKKAIDKKMSFKGATPTITTKKYSVNTIVNKDKDKEKKNDRDKYNKYNDNYNPYEKNLDSRDNQETHITQTQQQLLSQPSFITQSYQPIEETAEYKQFFSPFDAIIQNMVKLKENLKNKDDYTLNDILSDIKNNESNHIESSESSLCKQSPKTNKTDNSKLTMKDKNNLDNYISDNSESRVRTYKMLFSNLNKVVKSMEGSLRKLDEANAKIQSTNQNNQYNQYNQSINNNQLNYQQIPTRLNSNSPNVKTKTSNATNSNQIKGLKSINTENYNLTTSCSIPKKTFNSSNKLTHSYQGQGTILQTSTIPENNNYGNLNTNTNNNNFYNTINTNTNSLTHNTNTYAFLDILNTQQNFNTIYNRTTYHNTQHNPNNTGDNVQESFYGDIGEDDKIEIKIPKSEFSNTIDVVEPRRCFSITTRKVNQKLEYLDKEHNYNKKHNVEQNPFNKPKKLDIESIKLDQNVKVCYYLMIIV